MPNKLFTSLSQEEKIDFFIKCQSLLVKYHPESEFIFRQDNYETRKQFVKDFVNNYKGFCFSDDNICILFNHVHVENPDDPIKILKDHIYQAPKEDFNCVSVDFVVFRELHDCAKFVGDNNAPNIKYVLFVKNNEIKLYETEKLVNRANLV